jgi:6-phosphogluconolactonase
MGVWVFVGSYTAPDALGGIGVFHFDPETRALTRVGAADRGLEAGYLRYAPLHQMLYAVDERKTDGRGPVGLTAAVHSFSFDPATGTLNWANSQNAPGPFPTYLDLDTEQRSLLCANHGSFDHTERVVRTTEGWGVEYDYDASAVILYHIEADGMIGAIRDLHLLDGHGMDPNSSPQAGGHAQSGPHAHCAVIDPSGQFVVVSDKGTDRVLTYRLGEGLVLVAAHQFPPETAPRHIVFSPDGTRAYLTLEIASEVASMAFDRETGRLTLIDRVQATADGFVGLNEPAEIRLHPNGRFVYLNNRGEDSLASFGIEQDGRLSRVGHVSVARSIHPGLAARSFAFVPGGQAILFADRPANLVRVFAVDPETGTPIEVSAAEVSSPVFIELDLEGPTP